MNKNYQEALDRIAKAKERKYNALDLSSLGLTELPFNILELTGLTVLYLNNNQLVSLPENFHTLDNLKTVWLQNNQLSRLPENFCKLNKLKVLILNGNRLRNLPLNFCRLTKLEKLYLKNNRLVSLPENFYRLNKLIKLRIANNELTRLPKSFYNLNKLEELTLSDNRFALGRELNDLLPAEKINEILKWQRAKQQKQLRPIHEAKAIFIGQSNYGKTHLIEYLKKGKIEREIKTTHGIERNQLKIPYKDIHIRLNIWDLGGQKFMRSTHQFFFSERTLYVLVTLARRERSELNHWLKLANQLGNNAPVLVVINKIDLDSHDLDRKSLQRDYPNVLGFVRTSIYDCDEATAETSIHTLFEKIKSIVTNPKRIPSVFEQRRPEWFLVKEELEKLETKGKDYISYNEYKELDHIRNLEPVDQKSTLSLLSILGTVVSYVNDPRLRDTNVINPQWIMDGVYAIINDPTIKDKNKGRLHINDLERVLNPKRFPPDRHTFLLDLMHKFNLCYASKYDRDTYFIPDLFEDIEPNAEWANGTVMCFRYNYDDSPPDSFMTRFIVEMHEDIVDEKRWRSGVYISNNSCKAKVYQSYRRNVIDIEIKGNNKERRMYLYAIREIFRGLHEPFPNMKIAEEINYKEYWIDYKKLKRREERKKQFYHDELDEYLPIADILNGYNQEEGLFSNIKSLVAAAKIEVAIADLRAIKSLSNEQTAEINALSSRYEQWKKQKRNGTHSYDELTRQKNKIVADLLSSVTDLEK